MTMNRDKERKRNEAEERQEEYDKLTVQQKIESAEQQIGESRKVLEKLRQELAKEELLKDE